MPRFRPHTAAAVATCRAIRRGLLRPLQAASTLPGTLSSVLLCQGFCVTTQSVGPSAAAGFAVAPGVLRK